MNKSIVITCAVFLLYLLALPTNPASMFGDPDTGWHLATGDAVRALGRPPATDLWSFTAGDYPQISMAWAWDAAISWLYEKTGGWHGVIMLNALTVATTIALLFYLCLTRSNHGIAAFIFTYLLVVLINVNIRPHQASYLLIVIYSWILSEVARRHIRPHWLLLLPAGFVLWVNVHGAFIAGLMSMGMFGLAAIYERDWRLVKWLLPVGIFSLGACLISPYGLDIAEAVRRVMTSESRSFISEWQPVEFSSNHSSLIFYLFLFVLLFAMRPGSVLRAEKWLAYLWLFMAVTAVRNFAIFVMLTAPLLAPGLRELLVKRANAPVPWLIPISRWADEQISKRRTAWLAVLACVVASAWMFSPMAARMYGTDTFKHPVDLSEEIAFIAQHYPNTRFLNEYTIGGYLILQARTSLPLFVDGRAEASYPVALMHDYMAYIKSKPGWEEILDRYKIGGLIIPIEFDDMMDRFTQRKGWKLAFKGKVAAVFVRTSY